MASCLAFDAIAGLRKRATIFDPMSGSGTVARCAVEHGHRAIAIDADPLAVLMSRVWTANYQNKATLCLFEEVMDLAQKNYCENDRHLPWIDNDPETDAFSRYWFGESQRRALRALAAAIHDLDPADAHYTRSRSMDVVRIALSRLIITKEPKASLARDTSHSRPHRVMLESAYDVFEGLNASFKKLREQLSGQEFSGSATVHLGDARNVRAQCANESVDLVVTSPPYLNAIDYMRGHRLALIWFGYKVGDLRKIRATNIGSERGAISDARPFSEIVDSMVDRSLLNQRMQGMVNRYAEDVYYFMSEIRRVLRKNGSAVLVVGDSCLREVFISNSAAVEAAGKSVGLKLASLRVRELPVGSRYLPLPKDGNALSKRMKTETVISFTR